MLYGVDGLEAFFGVDDCCNVEKAGLVGFLEAFPVDFEGSNPTTGGWIRVFPRTCDVGAGALVCLLAVLEAPFLPMASETRPLPLVGRDEDRRDAPEMLPRSEAAEAGRVPGVDPVLGRGGGPIEVGTCDIWRW